MRYQEFLAKYDVDGMELSELSMTNCDHTIDDGLAEELQANPCQIRADYYGWYFFADVWYAEQQFHARVKSHHVVRGVISADSLPELMTAVCEEYGYE